jgi:DNA-binding winged helix-turn-helix (wHTH) protein
VPHLYPSLRERGHTRSVAARFRFGEFEFDAASHELRRTDGSDVQRLAPQPGELLHLLVANAGGVVTRDEIRRRLWPDTHVDFDASLHFCVRQVRAALGDSATDPRYVQNVPRRGYRLIPPVTTDNAGEAVATAPTAPAEQPPNARWAAAAAMALLLAVGSIAWYFVSARGPGDVQPIRIGIMPFDAPVGERILEDLMATAGGAVALVGPTTTSAYAASDADIQRLAVAYRLDYVINGRRLGASGRPVLAELIRVSDGAHVWVRPYDDLSDARRVGQEISRHVARVLELDRR